MYEVIAMVTMLIDHLGVVFFPDVLFLRMIGRLALPLYVYNLVQGTTYTKNYKRYSGRLLLLACVSQYFYQQLFDTTDINIIFTLLIASLMLKLKERWRRNIFRYYCTLFTVAVSVHLLHFDTGFITIVLADIYESNRWVLLKHAGIVVMNFLLDLRLVITIFFLQLLATFIILNYNNKRLRGYMRLFYQVFYPLHLCVLLIVQYFLVP